MIRPLISTLDSRVLMSIIGCMLSSRQEKLLNIIVDEYVKTAEPISSKALVSCGLFDLSSATIRNEMHDLESLGYLTQLHTSGGRIPTDHAYRLYVDNLLNEQNFEISRAHVSKIEEVFKNMDYDPRNINKSIAKLLSDISENVVITSIDEKDDFYKTGLASLFEMPEFREIDKAFKLTSFFDEFDKIFDKIEREFFGEVIGPSSDNNLNIFIGRENPFPSIKDETVMCAKYDLPDNFRGSLTLIGPTRMNYRKNIGLVKYATDRLNKMARKI